MPPKIEPLFPEEQPDWHELRVVVKCRYHSANIDIQKIEEALATALNQPGLKVGAVSFDGIK